MKLKALRFITLPCESNRNVNCRAVESTHWNAQRLPPSTQGGVCPPSTPLPMKPLLTPLMAEFSVQLGVSGPMSPEKNWRRVPLAS
jgi:hypothetical protein